MPKQIIDYSKTVMYKIRHITDINDEDVYVGHTTNFSIRKNGHKTTCNNIKSKSYNLKIYKEIRSKGGWGEWEMLPIELYPCSNKIDAVIREEYWRKDFNAKLNTLPAHITEKEYKAQLEEHYKVHPPKDKISKTPDEWAKNHKEEISQYQKGWYEENKEIQNVKHKTYRDEHKEKIAQHDRERYLTTKRVYLSENVICECGCELQKGQLTRHRKTKKHLDLMEQTNKNVCLLRE